MLQKLLSISTLTRILIIVPFGIVPISFYIYVWPYIRERIAEIPMDNKVLYGLLLLIVIIFVIVAMFYENKVLIHQPRSWKIIMMQIILSVIILLSSGLATSLILSLLLS